jgi:hypothetical protein
MADVRRRPPHHHLNITKADDLLVTLETPDLLREGFIQFSVALQLCPIVSRPRRFSLRKLAGVKPQPQPSQRSFVDPTLPSLFSFQSSLSADRQEVRCSQNRKRCIPRQLVAFPTRKEWHPYLPG